MSKAWECLWLSKEEEEDESTNDSSRWSTVYGANWSFFWSCCWSSCWWLWWLTRGSPWSNSIVSLFVWITGKSPNSREGKKKRLYFFSSFLEKILSLLFFRLWILFFVTLRNPLLSVELSLSLSHWCEKATSRSVKCRASLLSFLLLRTSVHVSKNVSN